MRRNDGRSSPRTPTGERKPTRTEATPRQLDVLRFVATYLAEHGEAPLQSEIRLGLGLSSSAEAHTHLRILQERGYVTRDPNRCKRDVVLTDKGREAIA